MTQLSKEQDAELKSLLESLVTEIYLDKVDVNLFTAEIVENALHGVGRRGGVGGGTYILSLDDVGGGVVQFSIMTKIRELKQNTFLGRRGAYNRKTLGVDLGCGRREWELDCTSGSRCSFILDCLNRDEMFNQF